MAKMELKQLQCSTRIYSFDGKSSIGCDMEQLEQRNAKWIFIGFLQGGTVIPLLMMANNQFCFFLLKKVAAFSLFSQLNLLLHLLILFHEDNDRTLLRL